MKYSDEQRIQKIYENARKLLDYLTAHEITKEALLNDYEIVFDSDFSDLNHLV